MQSPSVSTGMRIGKRAACLDGDRGQRAPHGNRDGSGGVGPFVLETSESGQRNAYPE
ncbi:hypothetical protein [Burkholderia gladioli]|uniref:hypothetical protein n=1 Tax=Burkholderia gladioli TaxID=28095 RepID=UPI00164159B6|nr:hypothetical protein [Burkholderia gladioli]